MVSDEELRERELQRTLDTYQFLLKKGDDLIRSQTYVIVTLVIAVIGVLAVLAMDC